MSRAVWLALGVGIGFAAAHTVNKTPRGRALFERVDARLTEFADAVVDGYQGRDFELRGVRSDPTAPARAQVGPADAARIGPASTDSARDGQSPR